MTFRIMIFALIDVRVCEGHVIYFLCNVTVFLGLTRFVSGLLSLHAPVSFVMKAVRFWAFRGIMNPRYTQFLDEMFSFVFIAVMCFVIC